MRLAETLGIPLGATRRPAKGSSNQSLDGSDATTNDLVNSVIDITRDDICIGETPLFYKINRKRVGAKLRQRLDDFTEELNSIMSWVAADILKVGYSVYTYEVFKDKDDSNPKTVFTPVLDDLNFYLSPKKEIIVTDSNGTRLENVLVFLYYEKSNLEKCSEESDMKIAQMKINPVGLQLKNAKSAVNDLRMTELAIQRWRVQSSKILRFATVEVGVNKGDQNQDIIDDISEGLNANPIDLQQTTSFDDQIPVFPIRKNLGKPEISESALSVNIGELTDLDHNLSKLFLALRFPKTYADFSTALSTTAASMIRGDIRYSKLVSKGRSIIETTLNRFVKGIPALRDLGLIYYLTALPTPEDDDVVDSLQGFTDFSISAIDYILAAGSKDEAKSRLDTLTSLYSQSTNIKAIEKWLRSVMAVIEYRYQDEDVEPTEEPLPGGGELH